MSNNYQPIRILEVKKVNEYSMSNIYGFSGYGMYQYIKTQFNEAKQSGLPLIFDTTFIQIMQDQKHFDMRILYDMLFARHYFEISDPDGMQNVLYRMMIQNERNFPKYLSSDDFSQ